MLRKRAMKRKWADMMIMMITGMKKAQRFSLMTLLNLVQQLI